MAKIKVALINPGKSARYAVQEPLGIGFIAAYLEKYGYELRIIDQLAGEDVEQELKTFKPQVAGITATTPVVYDAYEVAALAKKMGILTVIGGAHASIFPEEAREHVDIVVKGEGEKTMLEILQKNITSGILTGEVINNLDEIPFPARHLMKMDRYLYCKRKVPYIGQLPYISANKRIVHMLTSRGCPHGKCIFCHNTWKNMAYRMDSPEKTVAEIKELWETYKIDAIDFVEDDFFADKERVVKLCELIIKNKLNHILWDGTSRVNHIEDIEVLKLAREAGCRSITLGIESASPRILEILKKGITPEDAKRAISTIKKAGIIAHGNFIIGNPTETLEDIEMSKKFIKETKLTTPEVYLFTPYPGSESWNNFKKQGLLPEKNDWSMYNQERLIVNATNIPTEQLESLRAEIYMSYFLRDPKRAFAIIFTSLIYSDAFFEKAVNTLAPTFKKYMRKIFPFLKKRNPSCEDGRGKEQ